MSGEVKGEGKARYRRANKCQRKEEKDAAEGN